MDVQVLVECSHLLFGAFATFCAILLWSRTRDLGWTFIIMGTIVSYAGIVFSTLVRFGILEEESFSMGGIPVVRMALDDLPLLFLAIGFLFVIVKRRSS
jgi:hypothetical protein